MQQYGHYTRMKEILRDSLCVTTEHEGRGEEIDIETHLVNPPELWVVRDKVNKIKSKP